VKHQDPIAEPTPLAETPTHELGELLHAASAWEPPAGAQERIWRRLAEPHLRLTESAELDPATRDILMSASAFEPPADAQERIWRRLVEEQSALAGLSEPQRLFESDAVLAGLLKEAARLEPAPGRQARVYRALRERQRPRWYLPAGALAATAAVLVAVLLLRSPTAVDSPPLALSTPQSSSLKVVRASGASESIGVGDRLEVATSDAERFQVRGVGDLLLQQRGASLALQQSDEHGVHLALSAGRVSIHADKRTRQAPLVVHAQGAEVEVVGTIFSVEATASGPRVFVKEGLVEVRAAGTVARVGAGQSWPDTSLIPSWANEAMNTLAGEQKASVTLPPLTVAAEPVALKKERLKPALNPKPTIDAKPPPGGPLIELPTLVPIQPVDAPSPTLVMPAPAPSTPRIKGSVTAVMSSLQRLEDDALDMSSLPILTLEKRAAELAKGSETRQRINVLFAIESSSDTSLYPEHRRAIQGRARVELAQLLEDTGALRNATDVRKKIILAGSSDDRAAARFANLVTFVALNDLEQGLKVAELCEREGAAPQRALVFVFKARLLANRGDLEAAESALTAAQVIDVNAPERAAAWFDDLAKRIPVHAGVLKQIGRELRDLGTEP
jgi:hypothetical protein